MHRNNQNPMKPQIHFDRPYLYHRGYSTSTRVLVICALFSVVGVLLTSCKNDSAHLKDIFYEHRTIENFMSVKEMPLDFDPAGCNAVRRESIVLHIVHEDGKPLSNTLIRVQLGSQKLYAGEYAPIIHTDTFTWCIGSKRGAYMSVIMLSKLDSIQYYWGQKNSIQLTGDDDVILFQNEDLDGNQMLVRRHSP